MTSLFANWPTAFIVFIIALFSACIGSFLNVVIYRMPLMVDDMPGISLAKPRSFCPRCKHKIYWFDNLPIFSYLWLHGRCRQCRLKIPASYLMVECLTVLLSVVIYWRLGLTNQMFAALLLSWWLIAMTMIDLKHYLLPDQLTLSLLWLGLILNIHSLFTSLDNAVLGAISGYFLLATVNFLYRLLRKKDGMGQGDWKLLAALGAWFGWIAIFYILAFAATAGAVWGILAIFNNKAKLESSIPFGPFLCFGGLCWLLANPSNWLGIC